jgi:hypothetical protein
VRFYQEALRARELVLLNRQNDNFKLFIDYIGDRKAIGIVRIVVPQRGLGRDSFFQRVKRLGVVVILSLRIVIGSHDVRLPVPLSA